MPTDTSHTTGVVHSMAELRCIGVAGGASHDAPEPEWAGSTARSPERGYCFCLWIRALRASRR